MHFAGVDIGSTMTKVVLIDKSDNQLSCIKGPTGPEHRRLANEVMRQALDLGADIINDIWALQRPGARARRSPR